MPSEPAKHQPLPEWASVLRTASRLRTFEKELAEYFDAIECDVTFEDGWVIPQDVEADGTRWGLTNLVATCAGAEEADWPEIIAGHFESLFTASEGDIDIESMSPEEVHKLLVPRLWEEGVLDPDEVSVVSRADIPGLVTVLCLDMPTSIRNVTEEECARLGSPEKLFAIALRNVESTVEPEIEEMELPDTPGATISVISGESFLIASLALAIGRRFPELFRHHGAFVSMPDRHTILALPLETGAALAAVSHLIGFTHETASESPGAISAMVWWTDGKGRWVELPYELEDGKLAVHASPELTDVIQRLE